MRKSLVIIPTYNEAENIEQMIAAIMQLKQPFDLLVIDDNSPDGTANLTKALLSTHKDRLFLIVRPTKEGLGPAYLEAFRWALDRDYDYIFEMDADFSHNPMDLINLQKELINNKTDVVIGSRYVRGIQVVNWPLSRILLSYFASLYVRIITGLPVKDTTAGFVGYSKQVLQSIDQNQIRFSGYAFQIELKFKAWINGFRLKEIPIVFTDRVRGSSKMNSSIVSEAIFGILLMKIKSWYAK
ncbi:MAG: polyprenol monophosphomannose synthase [Flavobacteriaceae bacterium]|jgi:dolichol-phosphate mannosyltransferase|nr:polyprenol monophosphomannose synthase [Flavobacteriaceae bacterium]